MMLPANPIDSPLFLPAAYRILILLGLSLALILWVERRNLGRILQASLFLKWRTWAIIAPIFVSAVLGGPLTLCVLVAAISWQGIREYAALVSLVPAYRNVLLGMTLIAAPVAVLSLDGFFLLAPLLLLVAVAQPLAFQSIAGGVRQLALSTLGWAYIAWLLAHLLLIAVHIPGGSGILLVLGASVALSDNGAFAVGKLFGRHQLSPALSPNKTWEGVAGNLIGAYAGTLLMGFALPESSYAFLLISLPPIIAIGSLWGDLFESAIKREAGVKDAGDWLPGFGGLLDRIDSLILVAPLTYYFLRLTQ
ncbi:phosphatidate cytidylyltransferase [Methylomicrobium lacus]|uniref:phosphatidate cytidylyltransferase n=1 Tax=Methylomicrobium lacus TaxID=136992 RepID=UPI0035A83F2B